MKNGFVELLKTKMADTLGIQDPTAIPTAELQKIAHASWEMEIMRNFTGREASFKVRIPRSMSTDGKGDHSVQFYGSVTATSVFFTCKGRMSIILTKQQERILSN